VFDVGFWELAVVGLITLLVVGPRELPTVARTLGRWTGQARRFLGRLREELEREVAKAEEIRRLMDREIQVAREHERLQGAPGPDAAPPEEGAPPEGGARAASAEASGGERR